MGYCLRTTICGTLVAGGQCTRLLYTKFTVKILMMFKTYIFVSGNKLSIEAKQYRVFLPRRRSHKNHHISIQNKALSDNFQHPDKKLYLLNQETPLVRKFDVDLHQCWLLSGIQQRQLLIPI